MPRSLATGRFIAFLGATMIGAVTAHADEPTPSQQLVRAIGNRDVFVLSVGPTLDAVVHREDLRYETDKTRILLVSRSPGGAQSVAKALSWFYTQDEAAAARKRFIVSGLPYRGGPKGDGPAFPPRGTAYSDPERPELIYLWRWIGMFAPDLVVEVAPGHGCRWFVPHGRNLRQDKLAAVLQPQVPGVPNSLPAALVEHAACETGPIPAIRVTTNGEGAAAPLEELFSAITSAGFKGPSPARKEIQQRLDRSPREVARQLSRHYGHDLKQVVYIPAVALIGRLRLGELDDDPAERADVERIVAPYLQGQRDSAPRSGSGLSGHLIFTELAARSEGPRREQYLRLARQAADLAFDEDSRPRASMPFHNEMSDALFMGGPILAHFGVLTGEARYFDACIRHLRFMRKLVLRADGLYRHSPLDEAAWGRGNGFPALGVALCLEHWPADRADRQELLGMLREHLAALKRHQDPTGCWHQVVDHTDSYRELTSTSMILFAAARAVRRGWVDADEYYPLIQKAWYAVRTRAPANGRLVDVCTGTGKQKDLLSYYHRTAILGPDPRGGAMALLAATEMAAYEAFESERP